MDKRKIMVVDDEPDFLKIIKLNLEETGHFEVMTLSSAKNVVAEVYAFRPDVILLDMLMPLTGGLDACAMLNRDPLGQGIPIIIVSALGKEQDKYKAYKQGVTDYLVKPIEKKDLIAAIENCLKDKNSKTA